MQSKVSLFFLFSFFLKSLLLAQNNPKLSEILPLDSQVVHKTLPNGLSYYILKNAKPENNCQIRLLVKAGSLQEENNEQGVAHFLEHLAFNGTKNFPKRKIVEELELMGNKFGADINAFTSFDRTVYMLEVPTKTNEKINKGLQIISDWAFNISFDAEEVEKEKGVVLSERRGRKSASEQYQKQMSALVMNNGRQTERYPIGDSLTILNAEPQLLQNFYRTWYRPNLMSVIVVGDFQNTAEIEQKIIELFGKAQNPKDEKPLLTYPIPLLDGFKTLILKDKEKTSFSFDYYNRQTFKSDSSLREFRETLAKSFANSLVNRYLYEENQKPNPPFLQCSFYPSFVDKTQMDMIFKVALREKDIASGIKAMLVERKKLMQHQFSKEQLEQIRFAYLKSYDNALQEFANTKNDTWVNAFLMAAFEKTPVYDSKKTIFLTKKILSEISVEEVNQQVQKMLAPQKNGLLMYYGMDKEGVQTPTDSLLQSIMQQVDNENVTKIIEVKSDKKLLSKIPSAIPFYKKTTKPFTEGNSENPSLFLTEYNFKNGAKVVVLPTKFKEDEVLFSAYSEGGHGKASFENRFNASYSARIIGNSGLSDMTPTEFRNLSFGKFSSVSPSLSEGKERIEGSFITKDADFFFQNLYATFLFPRKDNAVFEKFVSAQKQNIANRKLQPNAAFYDTLYALKTNFHPRAKSMTLADVNQLNLDKMFDFYKERFQNGGDFTYFFVGNTDLIPNFEEYLNTYIGSLSAQKNKDKSVSFDYKTPEGKHEIIKSDATDPQNKVEILLSGKQKFNRKNRQQIEMLATIVEGRLLIELREEKSAVYGVSCDGNVGSDNRYNITVNFGCEPGKEQELIAATYSIFEKIKAEGATAEEVQKNIENRKKTHEESRKSNNSLLSTLVYARQRNLSLDFFKTSDTANKHYYEMKPQDFSTLAKKYLNRKNEILSILKTKKKDGA